MLDKEFLEDLEKKTTDEIREIAKESVEGAEDIDLAHMLLDIAFKTFTVETFNFYDFSKVTFIQILALVNDGVLSDERVARVEGEIKKILNVLIADSRLELKKKKGGKR